MEPFERAAFLRAIVVAGDDPTPRLVFADFLDEDGDPDRAEFIRLQVGFERMDLDDPDREAAERRVFDLLYSHRVHWQNELPELPGIHWLQFVGGFVESLRADWPEAFVEQIGPALNSTPIRTVVLNRFETHHLRDVIAAPEFAQLWKLDLEGANRIGSAGLQALAHAPYMPALRGLNLRRNGIGPAGLRDLSRSPLADSLREVTLDWNELYDDGVVALATGRPTPELKVLSLGWCGLGLAGLEALTASANFPALSKLFLPGNPVGASAGAALRAANWRRLESLYLDGLELGDIGVAELARAEWLAGVKYLYLKDNRITSVGAEALLQSPFLDAIQELVLGDNPIPAATGQRLRERFGTRVILY